MLLSTLLVPAYVFPSQTSWSPIYDSIESNPGVNFAIIINPNSGPDTQVGSLPDPAWTDALTKLNAQNNTQAIGYVHTSWGTRCIGDVELDIQAYAAWGQSNPDFTISGIFFDESPLDDSTLMTGYMSEVASFARATLDVPTSHIVFNPGAPPAAAYYDIADTIVAFEGESDDFAAFSANSSDVLDNNEKIKAAYILRDFQGDTSAQADLVQTIANDNISAVLISTYSDYFQLSQYFSQLAAQVQALQ